MNYVTQSIWDRINAGELDLLEDILTRVKEEAKEEALLLLPEVVGNLMVQHSALRRTTEEFYRANPSFEQNKLLVAKILEKLDAENPGVDYSKLLEKATPLIREKMALAASCELAAPSVKPTPPAYMGELLEEER
ncbi:MAG: hypothetical protein DDT19_01903 [Syntrophomonadaceae bacterium]|nr:hypothetical protein [Bacillota bacterium]